MSNYSATDTPTRTRVRVDRRHALSFGAVMAAALLSGAVVLRYGADRDLLIGLLTVNVLVAVSRFDIDKRIIPNRIVLPAWVTVLTANIALHPSQWWEWLAASAGAAGLFLAFAQMSGGGVGMGDVKFTGFLGAALGGDILLALVIGTAASGLLAAAILIRHGAAGRKQTYALGPFLAGGGIVVILL